MQKTILLIYTDPIYRWKIHCASLFDSYHGIFNSIFIDEGVINGYTVWDDDRDTFNLINSSMAFWHDYTAPLSKIKHCQDFYSNGAIMRFPIKNFIKETFFSSKTIELLLIHTSSVGTDENCRWKIINQAINEVSAAHNEDFNIVKVYIGQNPPVDSGNQFDYKVVLYNQMRVINKDEFRENRKSICLHLEEIKRNSIYPHTGLMKKCTIPEGILPSEHLGTCPICGKQVKYNILSYGDREETAMISCSGCNFTLTNGYIGSSKNDWHDLISTWVNRVCDK